MTVPRYNLTPTYDIARVIVGGWQLSSGHTNRHIDKRQLTAQLHAMVDQGFTTFDCADIYTGVEEFFGNMRAELPANVRHLVQVHTKFVPDRDDLARVDREYVERIIDRSLQRLQCEQLDLVQFAWWDYDVPRYVETALHLVDLQRAGKIRHLGATNFNASTLSQLLDAGVPIIANQVQYSLLDRRPDHATADLAQAHEFAQLCYGTLAGGFLSHRYLHEPPPPEPFENRSLVKYRLIIDEAGGWERYQQLLNLLHMIAERHGTNVSGVALRWVLDRPTVGAVIVGTRSDAHAAQVLSAVDIVLDAEDHGALDSWLAEHPGPPGDVFDLERIPDGPHAAIMRYNLNRD